MKLHGSAALSLKKRKLLVGRVIDQQWSLTEAAAAPEVSGHGAQVGRALPCRGPSGAAGPLLPSAFEPDGDARRPGALIAQLRRGCRMTGAEIAETLRMPLKSVQGILTRIGLGKLWRLDQEEVVRYERSRPGELIHVDVKKLGRIEHGSGHRATGTKHDTPRSGPRGRQRNPVGREFCSIAIDDYSRLAYVELLEDEGDDCRGLPPPSGQVLRKPWHPGRARAHTQWIAIACSNTMDRHLVSFAHALACRQLRLKRLRTRPRRLQTNGKAERFVRTMLAGWAYGRIYGSSRERKNALEPWVDFYNRRRPHGALGHKPPVSRLSGNNPLGSYT